MKGMPLTAAKFHRRLMQILLLPMAIWFISGAYFVWMDLGFIRGDHYQPHSPDFLRPQQIRLTIVELQRRFPDATGIELTNIAGTPYYRLRGEQPLLVNAITGRAQQQITKSMAMTVAAAHVPEHYQITKVRAITTKAPQELSSCHLPVWQLQFDNLWATHLYVSMATGEVVTRRHELWRAFDLFWRLHIMDYDDGADVDNPLLLITALLAFVASLSGFYLAQKRWRRGKL